MPTRTSKLLRMLALLFSLTLVAACGSDDGEEVTSEGAAGEEATEEGGASFSEIDLSGVEITVASKDFTEQRVLGEVLVQAFEAAGATVTNQVDLGGTSVVRGALLAGEIDLYPEYNGTGWTLNLEREYDEVTGEDGTVESATLTEAVAELDLEQNGIRWLGRSPFNDTYGFASTPDLLDNGQQFTMQSMADYLAANQDTVVCMESEFPSRPDGLVLFEEATGYEIPETQQKVLDTGVIYTEIQAGECDFGEVFTTDGRIDALSLNLVDDPGIMIIYNVSIVVHDELYQQAPEAFDQIADLIFAPLDNATMTELNRLVDIEGIPPSDVAATFLQEQQLVGS
jgi:osmoprotectant transport system substrate-binding protein